MHKDVFQAGPAPVQATHLIDLAIQLSERQPESSFQLAQLAYLEAKRTSDEAAQWRALAQQIPVAGFLGMNIWLADNAQEAVRLGRLYGPPRLLRRIHGILGIAYLCLGRLAQSAEQHAQACVLAQQLDAAELAFALYNSSIGFNEFHRPERVLELGQDILTLDLSGLPEEVQHKVCSYGHLTRAAGLAHLAEYALLCGQDAEIMLHARRGLVAFGHLLELPPVTDNAAFQQRMLHVHVRLLELAGPVPEPGKQAAGSTAQLQEALQRWRTWTNAHEVRTNPRTEHRWLCALGREAALRQDPAEVQSYFQQALALTASMPFEDTAWLRLHSQYSHAARQVGDLETALVQMEAYNRLLFARLQHEARKTLEEMAARFQVAQAQHSSTAARRRADTLSQLVQEREHALYGEQLHTLERLATVAEYRDQDSRAHIHWVGDAAACVAQELGQPPEYVQGLQVAARLHDIGKIALPDAILLKPGCLTPAEFEMVKTHTFIGAEILEGPQHPFLPLAAAAARSHHERWDGSGYPLGLRAGAIPLEGRIVSVVDVYDALRAARPYKETWTEEAALTYIREGAGTQFDPQVVHAFLTAHAAGRLPQRRSASDNVQRSA